MNTSPCTTGLTEAQARNEICRVGKSLFDRGYAHATAGNISVRLGEAAGGGMLITPGDACLGFLDPDALARIDAGGIQTGGSRASKTIALHAGIYRAAARFDSNVQCVIHTHATHCVALSLRPGGPELLPALTPYFVMKVGRVPRIGYTRPGSPPGVDEVERTIARYGEGGRPIRAVMLDRLGPNVWHETPAAAMAVLEELEETARLMLLLSSAGAIPPESPEPLTGPQVDELRAAFAARW